MNKPVIGIDGSEANEKVKVGSSEYAYQLLNSLYRIYIKGNSGCEFIIFLKQPQINDLPPEKAGWRYEIIPSSRFWLIKKLVPRLIFGDKINLFFSPTHYLPVLTSVPQVCTIHDLGYLMFSGQFKKYDFWQLKYWTAISIYISKYIIAVSNSTRKDIVRHYPFASNKIETVYHGVNHNIFNRNISDNLVRHVKNKYKIRNNYILSLGTLKPSKNIDGIIRSFAKFLKENSGVSDEFQLVIAGKKGWMYQEVFQLIKDNNLKEKVILTDYVEEKDKPYLYKGATALISPSFWEGFGIHVLESMSCGIPVIVSGRGSLKEIAGKCGIYVNPDDIDSITKGIEKVVYMKPFEYNILSLSCERVAKNFTWDKTAENTLRILKSLLI
jgi:glycosyltransferase involved in cell wall biosynthesis